MGNLSEPSVFELATLAEKKAGKNVRLACQTLVLGDAVVKPGC
jgi:ferredoxin